ncbi:MAG: hypothetical protein WB445_04825 [Acinetobacter sp.]
MPEKQQRSSFKTEKSLFLYKFRAFMRRIQARQLWLLKMPNYKPIKKPA